MLRLDSFNGIYLHRDYVDMRKQVNGLSQIVAEEMELDVFGRYLFVFANRDRNRLKVLYWDKTGFALWYKRLERQRFKWAGKDDAEVVSLSASDLKRLLSGYNVFEKAHKKLQYTAII